MADTSSELPAQKLRIFISWSGSQAESVAKGLHELLPDVLDGVEPFFSGSGIDKGTRWRDILAGTLSDSSCGIVVLTHESLNAAWVAFEAGAVSRAAGGPDGAKSRIWPLLVGIDKAAVQLTPYEQYQSTVASDEKDTFRLINDINKICTAPVESGPLRKRFNKIFWPSFSEVLRSVPQGADTEAPSDSPIAPSEAMLREILNAIRSLQNRGPSPSLGLPIDFPNRLAVAQSLSRVVDQLKKRHGLVVRKLAPVSDRGWLWSFSDGTSQEMSGHLVETLMELPPPSDAEIIADAVAASRTKRADGEAEKSADGE